MALNTSKCNHLTPLPFKGLTDPCFDISVVVNCAVDAEYRLNLTLCLVSINRSPWVVVEQDAARRRNEGTAGKRCMVKPGAVQVVGRTVDAATVQLPVDIATYSVAQK